MTKADDQRLQALAKKNAAKVVKAKKKERRRYDDTLPEESEEDLDRQKFFSDMKRREF